MKENSSPHLSKCTRWHDLLASILFGIGLFFPVVMVMSHGWTLTSVYYDDVGFRYFYSLRLLYGNEADMSFFIPQGHLPGLFHQMIQWLLTRMGYSPYSLLPRIDYFAYLAILLPHLLSLAAFRWLITSLQTFLAKLGTALFWLLPYWGLDIDGAYNAIRPDYHLWILPIGLVTAGLLIRQPKHPRSRLRYAATLGIFAGLSGAIKITLLVFPAMVGLTFLLQRKKNLTRSLIISACVAGGTWLVWLTLATIQGAPGTMLIDSLLIDSLHYQFTRKVTFLIFPIAFGLTILLRIRKDLLQSLGRIGCCIGMAGLVWLVTIVSYHHGSSSKANFEISRIIRFCGWAYAHTPAAYQSHLQSVTDSAFLRMIAFFLPFLLLILIILCRPKDALALPLALLSGSIVYHGLWILRPTRISITFEATILALVGLWTVFFALRNSKPPLQRPQRSNLQGGALTLICLTVIAQHLPEMDEVFQVIGQTHRENKKLQDILMEKRTPIAFVSVNEDCVPHSIDGALYLGLGHGPFQESQRPCPLLRRIRPEQDYFNLKDKERTIDWKTFPTVVLAKPWKSDKGSHLEDMRRYFRIPLSHLTKEQLFYPGCGPLLYIYSFEPEPK